MADNPNPQMNRPPSPTPTFTNSNNQSSEFYEHAVNGDSEFFKMHQQNNLQQIVLDQSNSTILHVHIKHSNMPSAEFVKEILTICPSLLGKVNVYGDTPIHFAAERGDSAIAKVLLNRARGSENGGLLITEMLNMKNVNGKTAIDKAEENNKIDVLKILIDEAQPSSLDFAHNLSKILCMAAREGNHEILDAIAAKGQNGLMGLQEALTRDDFHVEGSQSSGTILHVHIHSSKKPSTTFVKELLNKCPALLLKSDGRGDSPLHVAFNSERFEIAKVLIECARGQPQDQAEGGERFEIRMLKMKNEYGTVLDEAIKSGNMKGMNLLIQEADHEFLYLPDNIGKILALAAREGDDQMVSEIAKRPGGETALLMNLKGSQSNDSILHEHIRSSWRLSTEFCGKILEICPSLLLKDDADGDTPLHVAVQFQKFIAVEFLLKYARGEAQTQESEERADQGILNKKNSRGNTALDEAVLALDDVSRANPEEEEWLEYRRKEKLKERAGVMRILFKEANPGVLYSQNIINKILNLAARRGHHEILDAVAMNDDIPDYLDRKKALDEALMNPDIPGAESEDTFLHISIKSSQTSVKFIERVFELCPPLLMKANAKGDTPLHVAAKHGHNHLVEVLIRWAKRPGLLGMKNMENNTALHEAVRHGNRKLVEILTKAQPFISYSPNNTGETPLYLAAARGYYHIVLAILKNCRSVTYEGPNGMTALHAAAMNSKIRDAESLTRDAAADSEKEGDYSVRMMKAILERESNLTNKVDQYGWTPLHYAAYHGHSDKVSLLLRFDRSTAFIKDKDRKMTALHLAAGQGHKEVIDNIISQCEDCCKMEDNRGWNVLHYAMLSLNKKELVDLLTNPLVKDLINNKDKNGNTPLHIRAAAYRETFSFIGNRETVNNQNLNVEHVLKYGSLELEEQIRKLFEDVGNGQYTKAVISNDDCLKILDERRKKYYEGLKETRSSQLLVATLIATVTFTAAFTIPGGYNSEKASDKGTAILNRNLAFQLFIITDTAAMTLSLSAVFVHFMMSFEKFQSESLFTFALCLTMLSMGAVVFAFVTGIYSVLAPSLWLAITTTAVGLGFFLFVLCTLKLIYWGAFLEWLRRKWKLSKRQDVLPTHFKGN